MIYARRVKGGPFWSGTDDDLAGSAVVSGPSGAFAVYSGAAQVSATLTVGGVVIDNAAQLALTVRNSGQADMTWSGVAVSGPHAADVTTTQTLPVTIAPGASADMVLTVAPGGVSAGRSAVVTLSGTHGEAFQFTVVFDGLSDVVDAPVLAKPHPPTAISLSANGTWWQLRWTPAADAVGTYVYWGTSPGVYTVTVDAGATNSMTVSGVFDGSVTYYVRLAGYNSAGVGATSAEYSITPEPSDDNQTGGGEPLPESDTMRWFSLENAYTNGETWATRNVTPMVVIDCIREPGTPPEAWAATAARSLLTLPPGKRCLHPIHVGYGRTDAADAFGSTTHAGLVQGGFPTSDWELLFSRLWLELRELGQDCDYIVLDEETVRGDTGAPLMPQYWSAGANSAARALVMGTVCDLPATVRHKLPYRVRGLTLADWQRLSDVHSSVEDYAGWWDRFVWAERAAALRRIVGDTYRSVYGRVIPTMNYADARPTAPRRGLTGWTEPAMDCAVGEWSSPSLYQQYAKVQPLISGVVKAQSWNMVIRYLNYLRALRSPTSFWLARNSWNGSDSDPTYTETMPHNATIIKHAAAMGIRLGYFWCPGVTETELAEFQQMVETSLVKDRPRRRLRPIPYDADIIVTNGVVTRYTDAVWT